jgi:hypothetical protein
LENPGDVAKTVSAGLDIFIGGRAIYRDVFSEKWRLTEFMWRYRDFRTDTGDPKTVRAHDINAYGHEHNCIDEECTSYSDPATFQQVAETPQ